MDDILDDFEVMSYAVMKNPLWESQASERLQNDKTFQNVVHQSYESEKLRIELEIKLLEQKKMERQHNQYKRKKENVTDPSSPKRAKHDHYGEDIPLEIKEAIDRIKEIKDTTSIQYLEVIKKEFDQVFFPSMKKHWSRALLMPHIPISTALGQAFKNYVILGAMVQILGIETMKKYRNSYYANCKRVISWNKFSRDFKDQVGICTSSFDEFQKIFKH